MCFMLTEVSYICEDGVMPVCVYKACVCRFTQRPEGGLGSPGADFFY